MPTGKLIDWDYLRDNYIVLGTPIEDPILDEPEFRLVFHPNPPQLGVRLQLAVGQESPKTGQLRNVSVSRVQIADRYYLQVTTSAEDLFPSIYALIADVLRRIEGGEKDCLLALTQSLQNFEALLARATGISREEVVGIYGELLVLESLMNAGRTDIRAWIGANRQSHDIRFGNEELEVKTTVANSRHHFIHGLNQLSPSPKHDLFLISVRLGMAGSGAGRSLDDLIASIHAVLPANAQDAQYFKDELMKTSYVRGQYECAVAYQIAAVPMKIAVGADFPIVNHSCLSALMGDQAASRIMKFDLLLNLEGLGVEFIPGQM